MFGQMSNIVAKDVAAVAACAFDATLLPHLLPLLPYPHGYGPTGHAAIRETGD